MKIPLASIKRISAIAFLVLMLPAIAKAQQTNASVDLRHYAAHYGRSAGNDLGNQVLTRMHSKGIKFDSEQARNQCYAAVTRLLSDSKMPVPWTLPDGKRTGMQPIGKSTKRRFILDLPGGGRWDEDVEIAFKVDPKHSTTDSLHLWIEFTITDPDKRSARITVSGACTVHNTPTK